MENISTEEIKAFVGEKSDYYIKSLKSLKRWKYKLELVCLLLRRSMDVLQKDVSLRYWHFLGILFLNIILEILKVNPVVSTGVSLWLWIGFGMFGNYIYYIFVINSIKS